MISTIYQNRYAPKTLPLIVVSRVVVKTRQEHQKRIKKYKQMLNEKYGGSILLVYDTER